MYFPTTMIFQMTVFYMQVCGSEPVSLSLFLLWQVSVKKGERDKGENSLLPRQFNFFGGLVLFYVLFCATIMKAGTLQYANMEERQILFQQHILSLGYNLIPNVPCNSVASMTDAEKATWHTMVLLGSKNIGPVERTACRCIAVRKQNCFMAEKKQKKYMSIWVVLQHGA